MKSKAFVISLMVLVLAGCATTKVTRVETEKKVDLSGNWNDYDALLVSQEMIKDCTDKPWFNKFLVAKNRNPVMIVGYVQNKTSEHINADVITKRLEHELLNSGKATIVASVEEREGVRDERQEQQRGFTSPETIKAMGKEKGADFMLIGSMNSIKDQVKGKFTVLYQVNLELIDLETNEKVWIGQKELKKVVENAKFSL